MRRLFFGKEKAGCEYFILSKGTYFFLNSPTEFSMFIKENIFSWLHGYCT